MVKRFLFLAIWLFAFAVLKAQISYTGYLPLTEDTEGCDAPQPMSSDEAFGYLSEHIVFNSPDDCGLFYTVECSISDPVTRESCYFTVIRSFLVTDACGNEETFNQMLFVYYNQDDFAGETLPDRTFDAFSVEEMLPNNTASIDAYLYNYGVEYPSCWDDHEASYTAVAIGENADCSVIYILYFKINPVGCPQQLTLKQNVVLAPTGLVQCSSSQMTPLNLQGCSENESFYRIRTIDAFSDYGVEFSDYLHGDLFEISCVDDFDEGSPCDDYLILRTYTVTYPCTEQEFVINQEVHIKPVFHVSGSLPPAIFSDSDGLPQPLTRNELFDELDIHYSCGIDNLDISNEDFPDLDNDYLIERKYYIKGKCDEIEETVLQYLFKMELEPDEFLLAKHRDVSFEGAKDGYAELRKPSGLYCNSCPGQEGKIFKVVWHNKSTDEIWTTSSEDPECDIFTIETLSAGNYEVSVYPICPDFSWDDTPIFKDEFVIHIRKMQVTITSGPGVGAVNMYGGFVSDITFVDEDNQYISMSIAERNKILGHFSDKWVKPLGTLIYSPMLIEFDMYDITTEYNVYSPQGVGAFQNIVDTYQRMNNDYGYGFQRYVLVKWPSNLDVGVSKIYYKIYEKDKIGQIPEPAPYKEEYRIVYRGDIICSEDPNEIFGPVGYTDADSVCVRMINANDDVNYTIMFENDPEFATAAAARVKIICPLSDKMDPTTFRLGNFGFNNMTFEVPELSSYYNKRLQIDSLGYCLDVTAALNPTENYAYWIFQTIDPETGVAPIDSLGFLPVNDTLTGCGEGFVSFTVGFGHNGNLHTTDSLVESAEIYFDENAVVPTNNYVNQLDVVAPSSYIVCDTTGSFQNKLLALHFVAADDEGGSGVEYVELYVNVDQMGYEPIANVHPDSVYVYSMVQGAHFEFFGLAVDNVGNKEEFKFLPELVYMLGNPPTSISLSNDNFKENDEVGTSVGNFKTIDDQTSDVFGYSLVDGEGSSDNNLFRIEGNKLLTNFDFRCYGIYEYNIRVRSTDLSGLYMEKSFAIRAIRTEEVAPVTVYESLCPGESIIFGNESITAGGVYEHTFSSALGCDSLVYMNVTMNEVAPTEFFSDNICLNYGYEDHGFVLSPETIAALTQGWSMASDTTIFVDQYKDNVFGCTDTIRLTLTVNPAFDIEDNHLVCPTDLPYVYNNRPYISDTTVLLSFTNKYGCDSIVHFNLTLNPNSGTQSDELSGWRWYSTYIDQANGKGLGNLQDALGDKGLIIKSMDKFNSYASEIGQWVGSLLALNNAESYKIQTSSPVTADVSGCYVDVQTVPINLHQGWNWIGFPSSQTMDLATAMGDLPTNGDIVKSQDAFSAYVGSVNQWIGSLTMLQPGEGYQYESNNPATVELVYPSATRASGTPPQLPEAHWLADEHRFADNVTFIGLIQLDGQAIESDTLEVGAFCRGEERGSARALYVEPLDAYRVFLTVHGANGDTLSFRLFDHNRDKERRIRSRQQEIFLADNHYGTIDHPYPFNFNTDYDKLIEAEICEGQYYVDNGFLAYREGTYFQERQNDSIIRLDLTVNPVYHEEKSVVAFEFPFNYNGMVFDGPGIYNLQYNTAEECDSTLALTVQPYDGLRELLISPVPAERDQRVTLFFPFKAAEQSGLQVEIFSLSGNLIQVVKPKRFPIELDPFTTSGTYMVKITMGTSEVVTGKIIVK